MNTRQSILKKAIDLQVGDIIDSRRHYGFGYRYHVVDSLPSRRQSDPTQVVFSCRVWDPDDILPDGDEGRQGCSTTFRADDLIRLPINGPDKMRESW